MPDELILVAGASGALGSVLVRRLLARGYPVRALGRNPRKLAQLGVHGAEPFVADMLDRGAMDEACAGVSLVVSTANNILGKGRTSCNRIDEEMYRTSGAAAKAAGVRRWIHISARNLAPDSPVDYFRVKHRVEAIVRGFDVPWVVIRPSAFIDVWMGVLFGDVEQPKKVATVFGDGGSVVNYIAMDDVASFVLAIVRDDSVRNEIIDVGGPTETSFVDFASRVQRIRRLPERRRHVPVPVLGLARRVVRPFNEVAARFASLGWWTTLGDRRFPEWRLAATRFRVDPVTLDEFAEQHYAPPRVYD
jgi:uncharacterized protein YbjT (DUF2867 family)